MAKPTVEDLLATSTHGRIDEVRLLRDAILAANPDLTEQVKWNAPSFCAAGDDRVTFRLHPGDRVELIFHRGARVRTDVDAFSFDDPTGRIAWATPDRGSLAFTDAADVAGSAAAVASLVTAWVAATTD